MSKETLLSALESEKDHSIHFLQTLLRAPSANPPGNTVTAARVVSNFLAHHGIPFEIIEPKEDAPNVVSHFSTTSTSSRSAGPTLVLNGHLDVFPVGDDERWEHDPWGGEIADGRVYGRGVVDMKAGLAATIIAYGMLHRFRSSLPPCTIVLEAVSDEETGGKWGSKYLVNDDEQAPLWRGDVVMNAEPTGLQSVRFGEKGTLRLVFVVETKGAHGAYTHLDEGAVRIAARLIGVLVERIENFTDFILDPETAGLLKRKDVRDTVDEIMGPGAAENVARPTVNIGTIRGGTKVNVVPSSCTFELDVRIPIGLTQTPILALIDEILEGDFPKARYEVVQAASNPPNHCSPFHPLVTAIADNAEQTLGRRPLPIPSLGATDAKHWRYLGVPAYSFGVSPEGEAMRDESVALKDFLNLTKVLAGAAWDFLEGEVKQGE